MGMFDTILLEPPMRCPRCGLPLTIQTKLFDAVMQSYRIGDVLSSSPVLYGVLQEQTFCRNCHKEEREPTTELYLVVWHSILAAVELTEEAAQNRLAEIDRLDLIRWLDAAQRRESEWRRRFRSFYNEVARWHEETKHREAAKREHEEADREGRFRTPFRLPDEIVNADDPLAEILARHQDHSTEDDPWL